MLDRTDVLARLAVLDTVRDRMRAVALWQFLNFVRDRGPLGAGAPIQRTLDRVRQLVLLAEERDLRQIPAAALHMDAVRLMTIHGSKGLEFEAVHLPGLTVSSIPARHQRARCPPPQGLMEVVSPDAAHAMEEECLFFVALSRAKQILRISKCRKTSDGKNRTPSPYLDWLVPTVVTEVSNAGMLPLPADARRPMPIRITWPAGWSVTDSRLRTFERCPRRFFYTHVLGLGGRRKVTPFSQTHDCLYQLIRWLAEARVEGDVSHAEAEKEFERLWSDGGPLDHAYATDYRRLADRLVGVLVKLGAGHRFRRSEPLAINLRSGRVIVEPDEMTELSDGTVILRKVRTGYKRSDEYDRTEYSLYHLAGRQRFGDAYAVEALHLSDENLEAVIIKPPKLKTRQGRSETMLGDIGAGRFPPDPDQVTCPRCPHFFVCDAVGRGPLALTEF